MTPKEERNVSISCPWGKQFKAWMSHYLCPNMENKKKDFSHTWENFNTGTRSNSINPKQKPLILRFYSELCTLSAFPGDKINIFLDTVGRGGHGLLSK